MHYLQAIGINSGLTFSGSDTMVHQPAPPWAAFFLWLGWWMRTQARDDRRLFSVVVTPTRHTTALLAAFGAQLAGAKLSEGALDWSTLTKLPSGTKIFIQERKEQNKSGGRQVLGEIEGVIRVPELQNQEFVLIRQKNGTRQLSVNHLHQYIITLQSVGGRTKTAIHRHSELFRTLVPGFDPKWFITSSTESVIAGEAAGLLREGDSLKVSASRSDQWFSIGRVLGIDSPLVQSHAKTALITPRHLVDQPLPAPVCILDGGSSFRSLDHCMSVTGAGAIVAILDRTEFDDQFRQRALAWQEASRPELLSGCESVPQVLPAGLECIICAIPLSR